MKVALSIILLAILVGVGALLWINHDINEAAKSNYQTRCDTDAFNYKGVRPDWCKE